MPCFLSEKNAVRITYGEKNDFIASLTIACPKVSAFPSSETTFIPTTNFPGVPMYLGLAVIQAQRTNENTKYTIENINVQTNAKIPIPLGSLLLAVRIKNIIIPKSIQ